MSFVKESPPHCNTMQYTATHCNTLHTLRHSATHCKFRVVGRRAHVCVHMYVCIHSHTVIYCNALERNATHCDTLLHIANIGLLEEELMSFVKESLTHCNTDTLQYTATRCNTLQHCAAHLNSWLLEEELLSPVKESLTHCNTLQYTATQCNTLQHSAASCEFRVVGGRAFVVRERIATAPL